MKELRDSKKSVFFERNTNKMDKIFNEIKEIFLKIKKI
jgi:hypothetical protein